MVQRFLTLHVYSKMLLYVLTGLVLYLHKSAKAFDHFKKIKIYFKTIQTVKVLFHIMAYNEMLQDNYNISEVAYCDSKL
jgi:hypothetical protein